MPQSDKTVHTVSHRGSFFLVAGFRPGREAIDQKRFVDSPGNMTALQNLKPHRIILMHFVMLHGILKKQFPPHQDRRAGDHILLQKLAVGDGLWCMEAAGEILAGLIDEPAAGEYQIGQYGICQTIRPCDSLDLFF